MPNLTRAGARKRFFYSENIRPVNCFANSEVRANLMLVAGGLGVLSILLLVAFDSAKASGNWEIGRLRHRRAATGTAILRERFSSS